jgi:hypothetical protein
MRYSFFLMACAAATAGLANQDAAAQEAGSPKHGAALGAQNSSPPVGFSFSPNISFVPTAFTELGFDTNPDQTSNPKSTAFSKSGVGFGLGSVSKEMVANVSANGSWVDYFDDPNRPTRLAGAAQANLTYLIQPGWTVTGAGAAAHDSQSFNRSETAGASLETAYRTDSAMTFLKGRFNEVRYLNANDPSNTTAPILLTPEFNYDRSEVNWGGIYGTQYWLSPYAEVSNARVKYTDQPAKALVDRDASDNYIKTGMRVTLSPSLYTDLGWRWNWRNLTDAKLREFASNSFDGAATWRPSPFFALTASAQRTIGEATMDHALLSDIRSYEIKVSYLPFAGVTVSVAGVWQDVSQIGSNIAYRSDALDGAIAYDYSTHLQLYTSVHYEYFSTDWRDTEYDRFRILAGMRIIPDGAPLLPLEPAGGFKDFVPGGPMRFPGGATLTASAGYSWFSLPAMKMATAVGGPFWDEAVGQVENIGGGFNGLRTDLRLENFARQQLPDGQTLAFGLSGFYAHYSGSANTHCMYSATQDCAFVNVVDASKSLENNTGPFGDLRITTRRDVDYYGAAADVRFAGPGGGYKDDGAVLSPLRFGFSFRGLDQNTKLTAVDPLVCDPVRYKEWLNTRYYGAYAGYDRTFPVAQTGWMLGVDGTAGLYYARSEYVGRYSAYAPVYGVGYVEDAGAAKNEFAHGAFIGTLRAGLSKDFGWMSAGFYGQAEYLGYAPKILYNNNDYAGGAPWGIVGNNATTHIGGGEALNYTVGVSVTLKTD